MEIEKIPLETLQALLRDQGPEFCMAHVNITAVIKFLESRGYAVSNASAPLHESGIYADDDYFTAALILICIFLLWQIRLYLQSLYRTFTWWRAGSRK